MVHCVGASLRFFFCKSGELKRGIHRYCITHFERLQAFCVTDSSEECSRGSLVKLRHGLVSGRVSPVAFVSSTGSQSHKPPRFVLEILLYFDGERRAKREERRAKKEFISNDSQKPNQNEPVSKLSPLGTSTWVMQDSILWPPYFRGYLDLRQKLPICRGICCFLNHLEPIRLCYELSVF